MIKTNPEANAVKCVIVSKRVSVCPSRRQRSPGVFILKRGEQCFQRYQFQVLTNSAAVWTAGVSCRSSNAFLKPNCGDVDVAIVSHSCETGPRVTFTATLQHSI